jgi:hypothetical protein
MNGDKDPNTQVESPEVAESKPGESTPQVNEATPAPQPGETGEQKPIAKTPRTYSEDEVKDQIAKLTSAKDTELQKHKNEVARLNMQQRINQLAAQERQAQDKDKQAVENGTITAEEAESRKQARAETNRLSQVVEQLKPQAEQLGRIQLANDLAKSYKDKYGVTIDPDVLIRDKDIKSPTEMMQRASELALTSKNEELKTLKKPTPKPEVFDGGPGTNGGGVASEESRLKERYPSMYKK